MSAPRSCPERRRNLLKIGTLWKRCRRLMRPCKELLDKLSVSLTGEELEIIGKLYQQAMKLEVQFFSPQLVDQPVVAPLSRFNACRPASLLPPEESKSLEYNKLYEGMEVLADFEKLANSRVVDSGVLRGE
ncbi:unnamed protein product [Miscanthus lutarioriparius]|uniref:Uncharacterized protein n=1 Tax=Miscanthus lutarioriparius TaxID=422564 RepID=A0A811MUN7_9POAL|nr:unnamed protein product [Miscanthus lutarioriparius]